MKRKNLKTNTEEKVFTTEVYEEICRTIGTRRPESGGILGSSDGGRTIDYYYFDSTASTSGATYQPDTEAINTVIKSWNQMDISFVGVIHSHPWGCNTPSVGDYIYASNIIDAMDLPNDILYTPIVQVDSKLDGNIKIYSYSHRRTVLREYQPFRIMKKPVLVGEEKERAEAEAESFREKTVFSDLFPEEAEEKKITARQITACKITDDFIRERLFPEEQPEVRKETPTAKEPQEAAFCSTDVEVPEKGDKVPLENFKRIKDLYPLDVMKRKTIVGIGSGGAISYYVNMARSGVGNFVIFDKDRVSQTNVATQEVYLSEVGEYKGEVVKKRILDVNPEANVTVIPRFVDDEMSDEEFVELVGKGILESPTDYLIAGCTDDFFAQARSAALGLKYGTTYVAVQLYMGGMASELYFGYPGVTNNSCPRCAMSSRYDAYLKNHAQNDITSAGTPIFATDRTNATKGYVSLMLLLYHEDENCIFNTMLDQVADRNFLMIRMNPFLNDKLGIGLFDRSFAENNMTFFDETLWIPQTPNDGTNGYEVCPLCGGDGDLRKLRGTIEDTRIIH